jgi:hypothetical protein
LTERKTTPNKEGDVYLALTNTQSDQDVWLIDSGASYNMTPHREWVCEYEKYEGEDVMQEHHSMSTACQPANTSSMHLMEKGRGATLSILKFEFQ